jgi:hypothetical protein
VNKIRGLLLLFLILSACTAPARVTDSPAPETTRVTIAAVSAYPPQQATAYPVYPAPPTQGIVSPISTESAVTPVAAGPTAQQMLMGLDSEVVSVSFTNQQPWLAAVTQDNPTIYIWNLHYG